MPVASMKGDPIVDTAIELLVFSPVMLLFEYFLYYFF